MEEPRITPLARRLAEENGIDWRKLQGTGPEGTIVERDILAFLAKVMAGEVDLPPAPEPPPPPPPSPEELERAMSVLAKEGVHPEEVLPQEKEAKEAWEAEELEGLLDVDLEVDLDQAPEELEATLLTWPEPTPTLTESELDLGGAKEEPLLAEEELLLAEEAPPEPPLEAWEEEALEALLETKAEPLPPLEETLPPLEEATREAEPTEAPPQEPLEAPAPVQTPLAAAAVPFSAAAPAPVQAPLLRVHRARLDLGPARRAAEVLSRALGGQVGLEALLVQAAAKALAELELPHRVLLGGLEGEALKGHLPPAGGLRALARGERGEEGEGLLCLFGEEEVHTGAPLLYLHPEGLLTLSGPFEPRLARALLDRVRSYLEEPLLLFV
jgi:hypothetical protein